MAVYVNCRYWTEHKLTPVFLYFVFSVFSFNLIAKFGGGNAKNIEQFRTETVEP